jgi:hypothetical protein
MTRRLRENAVWIGFACLCTAVMAWLGLYGFAWNDYDEEARPAFEALVHGHLSSFLQLVPSYGGSLVLRAPFALATDLWGGGELAVYRMVSLPGLLAAAALGLYLVAGMRSRGRTALWRAVALGVCVANPLTLQALEMGHPEELMGGVLCVAAVLLAVNDRPLWAGLALGAAIANKEWALLAIGPVLLALPSRTQPGRGKQQILCLASAGATSVLVLGPLLFASAGRFAAVARGAAAAPGGLFQPWQVWWFLGTPNHVSSSIRPGGPVPMNAALSTHPGWRFEPGWLSGLSHPLIIAVMLPLTLLVWRRRGHPGTALLLLALLLLLRCMLDTWDTVYYPLPFVFALLAWETQTLGRTPLLAALVSVCAWIDFQWLSTHGSPDLQALVFLVVSGTALVAIAMALYAPNFHRRLVSKLRARLARKPTTLLARAAR